MRPLHFASFAILLTIPWQAGGFGQESPTPSKPPSTATTPAANTLIDNALRQLTRPEGVEVRFRQQVTGRHDPATILGRSITASGKKVHIDLEVKQVARSARMKLLCDGTMFHRVEMILDQNNIISYSLKDLQEALDKQATTETERLARDDLEKELQGMHGFEGIAAMVKDLKSRMIFGEPKATSIGLQDKSARSVKLIEGQWTKEVLDIVAPLKKGDNPNEQDRRYLWNEKLDYFFFPRTAKLYFDSASGELTLLELLAIKEKQGPEQVVVSLHLESITTLTKQDETLFQPTAEELKFKKITLDIAKEIKEQHQRALNVLKFQQSQSGSGEK